VGKKGMPIYGKQENKQKQEKPPPPRNCMEEEEKKLIDKDKEERKVSGNLVPSVDANNLLLFSLDRIFFS